MKLDQLFESDEQQSYDMWKKLVNLSTSELQKFVDSDLGNKAGLSRDDVKNTNLNRGRDSARAILRMKSKPFSKWNDLDIEWMKRQNSFISRMKGGAGDLVKDGIPTRRLTSLWIWGHSPNGLIPSKFLK